MMLTLAWTCVVVVGLPLVVGMCLRSARRRDASAAGGGGGDDGRRGGGGGDEPNRAAGTAHQAQAAVAAGSGAGIEVAPSHGRATAAEMGRPALPAAAGNTAAPAATTTTPTAVPLPPARYKVMTYNILAPDYANPAWFPGTNRGQLKWQTRQPGLFKTIAAANADLLCLQEVQVGNCRRSFEKFLKKDLGYDMAYSMKCTEEADPAYDSVTLGVLACWKRAKFRQVGAARTIALAQHVAALFGGDRFYSAGNWQVAVAVLLEPLNDDGAVVGDNHDHDRDSAASDTGNREAKRYVLLLSVHMMAPRGDHDYRRKYEQLVQTYALTRALAELKAAMMDDPTRPFVAAAAAAREDSTYARMGVAVPWEPAGSGSGGGGKQSDGADEQSDDDGTNAAGGGTGSDTVEAKDGEVTGAAVAAGGRERAVHAHVAVLLCGDFNAPPESASYALLRRGVEDARQDMLVLRRLFADTLRSPSEIAKVHRMAVADLDAGGLVLPAFDSAFALVEGTEPRHTNFTAKFRSCIDYIFVEALDECGDDGGDAEASSGGGAAQLSSWLRPVAAERSPHFELDALFRGTPQRSLPSDRFPSDHLPVVVTVEATAVAGRTGH